MKMIHDMTVQELAFLVQGEVVGNSSQIISGFNSLDEAGESDLSFMANSKYISNAENSRAGVVLIPPDIAVVHKTLILVKQPRKAFAVIMKNCSPKKEPFSGIDSRSFIATTAICASDVCIGAGVYVGKNTQIGEKTIIYPGSFIGDNCHIGGDVTIYPNVSVMEETQIGDRVIIGPNSVIGSDGFGFEIGHNGHHKIPHLGNVIIEDDVEFGSGCTVDRGVLGPTRIKQGAKLDNQVHIAHNSQVGEHNLLAGQTGFAGSVTSGEHVYLGGKAGINEHVNVCSHSILLGMSIATSDIKKPGIYAGFPAREHKKWQRASALLYTIEKQKQKIVKLEKRLSDLEKKNDRETSEKIPPSSVQ